MSMINQHYPNPSIVDTYKALKGESSPIDYLTPKEVEEEPLEEQSITNKVGFLIKV